MPQVRYLVLDEVDRMMELGWESFTVLNVKDTQKGLMDAHVVPK